MSHDESLPPPSRRTGGQFNLRTAFLLTTVIAVAAAVWGGLTREGENRILFVFFAAAAPFGVLVVLGIWSEVARWLRKR